MISWRIFGHDRLVYRQFSVFPSSLRLIFANSEAELKLLDIQVRPAVHRRTMAAIHCLLRGCEQSCFEVGDSLEVVRIVIN